ncbi:MAG TPA: type II toxin-antitoxin system RelE/ParE family toxin [Candidatus Paceibacterota bacterium]
MYKVISTDDYHRAVQGFPQHVRVLAKRQIDLLAANWRDSRLHVKKLRERRSIYSFRITRNYRAFFYFDTQDSIIVFDADDRKDAYRRR